MAVDGERVGDEISGMSVEWRWNNNHALMECVLRTNLK